MAERVRFELTNLFLDQTAFEAGPFTDTVVFPYDTRYILTYQVLQSVSLKQSGGSGGIRTPKPIARSNSVQNWAVPQYSSTSF